VPEPWGRIVGVLMIGISIYYVMMARLNAKALFPVTVVARVFVGVAFTALVIAGIATLPLLIFAGVDVAGALWTGVALKVGGRAA
jgi:hypothetical protein